MRNDLRFLTAAEYYGDGASETSIKIIDLGMVSLRDAAIYGRTRPLIPYADGRLIKSVRFVPAADESYNVQATFATPNTAFSGYGYGVSGDTTYDTTGLILDSLSTSIRGNGKDQILDAGPLIVFLDYPYPIDGLFAWQPETAYCTNDGILDSGGHLQVVGTGGGITGSGSEPTFDHSGGTTLDGSITWQDYGLIPDSDPDAAVHPIVEVVEGVSPMPQYPASIEFIAAPAGGVAGTPMPDITVLVRNQFGDPYTLNLGSYSTVENALLGSAATMNGGSQVVTSAIDPTTGIATFSISMDTPGTYVLRFRLSNNKTGGGVVADPIFSDPFDIT